MSDVQPTPANRIAIVRVSALNMNFLSFLWLFSMVVFQPFLLLLLLPLLLLFLFRICCFYFTEKSSSLSRFVRDGKCFQLRRCSQNSSRYTLHEMFYNIYIVMVCVFFFFLSFFLSLGKPHTISSLASKSKLRAKLSVRRENR